jgi:hypothetical protein
MSSITFSGTESQGRSATVTFDSKFSKEKTPSGKYVYNFPIHITDISIDGALITQDTPEQTLEAAVWTAPEECYSKERTTSIITQWYEQCSASFTKPPSLEICIQNIVSQIDPAAKAPILTAEEQTKDWIITWSPTRILLDAPKFILYWKPVGKKENTRINEELIFVTDSTGPTDQATTEPVTESTDTPIVQFEELNIDSITPQEQSQNFRRRPNNSTMDKDMNKVVSAYEKARHAYEKATHYNERFYKKYGFYAVDEDGSETSSFQSEPWTDYEDAE